MSDSNRVGLAILRNPATVFPVTTDPLALKNLRITGTPNLGFVPATIVSNEIRPDRQVTDLIPVGAEAGGDTGFELSANVADDLLESALFSTWNNNFTATPTTGAMGAGTIPFAATAGFAVGQLVKLTDPSVFPTTWTGTHGVYEITTVTSNVSITVTPYDAATLDTNLVNPPAIASTFSSNATTKVNIVGFLGASADISATAAGLASAATAFSNLRQAGTKNITPGMWIKIAGWTGVGKAATNSIWARVQSITTALITLTVPSNWQTDAGTGQRIAIFFGDFVNNGAEAVSAHRFIVERSFLDHSPVSYETFLGMNVNVLTMNMTPQAIATASVTFFGLKAKASTVLTDLYVATGGNLTRTASATNDVYNTSSNVGRIGRGSDPIALSGKNYVLEATVSLNNNLRRQNAVGVFGAAGIGVGELSITGNLNAYFDDLTLLNQVLNGTETSVDFVLRSKDGRALLVDIPRIKFSTGAPNVAGKNQDVVINLAYQGILSATYGYSISIQRILFSV